MIIVNRNSQNCGDFGKEKSMFDLLFLNKFLTCLSWELKHQPEPSHPGLAMFGKIIPSGSI